MGKLEGKITLTSGGATGIGPAITKRFVEEGLASFHNRAPGDQLANAAKEMGWNVTGVEGDVSNVADLDGLSSNEETEHASSKN